MFGIRKYPKSKEQMGTECSSLIKLKECVRIRVDKSQHTSLFRKKYIYMFPTTRYPEGPR